MSTPYPYVRVLPFGLFLLFTVFVSDLFPLSFSISLSMMEPRLSAKMLNLFTLTIISDAGIYLSLVNAEPDLCKGSE